MERAKPGDHDGRVQIVLEPGSNKPEELELTYRMLVAANISGQENNKTKIKDREKIVIESKQDVDVALAKTAPKLKYEVSDITKGEGKIPISLEFRNSKDFSPDAIIEQIDSLKDGVEKLSDLEIFKVLVQPSDNRRLILKFLQSASREDIENLLKELENE